MNKRSCTTAVLTVAWLIASGCQPITREKPEWFIQETYQEAIAGYQTLSFQLIRLGADGKESGKTADVVLARPNLLRIEVRDSGEPTDLMVSDGVRFNWTGQTRHSDGKAPARLEEMDLEPVLGLVVDPAPVLALEQVESTTETLDGVEVVRVRGTEARPNRPDVPVVVWISPDSGLPVKYRRTEGNRTVVFELRNLVVDAELAPGVFEP